MKATTPQAYDLLHQGTLALAQMEHVGIRIDVGYLGKAMEETTTKIKDLERRIKDSDVYKVWRRVYGDKVNLESGPQLATILFGEMGIPCHNRTMTDRPRTDEESLEKIDLPFVKDYLHLRKLKKVKGTYLQGIEREVCDGYIHPVFNLHTVRSFRGSADAPNFQNAPVRDAEQGEVVRRCIIPRKGRRLVEIDLVGAEVRVSACYNKDPKLIDYIKDPDKDMHRDSAVRLYMLRKEQVTKQIRYFAKNKFVFPQFYGSVYFQCAPALWEALDLPTADGVLLKDHLAKKGMTKLGRCEPKADPVRGTYEHYVKEIERRFWYEDFPAYTEWKENWFAEYCKNAGFPLLTGFWIEGIYERNKVLNYPVQGAAFHVLLKFIIMMTKWLKKKRMKSLLIGEIHDSAVSDNPEDEIQDYLQKAREIITEEIPKEWPWVIVPLEIEAQVCPKDGSWHLKKEWVETNGKWGEKQ